MKKLIGLFLLLISSSAIAVDGLDDEQITGFCNISYDRITESSMKISSDPSDKKLVKDTLALIRSYHQMCSKHQIEKKLDVTAKLENALMGK